MSSLKKGNLNSRENKLDLEGRVVEYLSSIFHGSLSIVKQDGYPIQFNVNEKYLSGEYLCR